MQHIGDRFVYAASDLNAYVECLHLVELTRRKALNEPGLERPKPDASSVLIAEKGNVHEANYLEEMRKLHGEKLIAFMERPENTEEGLRAAERRTLEAMDSGAPMIYQATFFDGEFYGRADFLRRVDDVASKRLDWSYEVIDTKLALSPKPYFLVQLCNYSEHLTRLLGVEPKHAVIVLGSAKERRFRLADFASYYRRLKEQFLAEVGTLNSTYPLACKHCGVCAWRERCESRREADDHLSLVAGMRRDQTEKLEAVEIRKVAELAAAPDESRPRKMADNTFKNLRAQAKEQHKQRLAIEAGSTYPYSYEFRLPEEEKAATDRVTTGLDQEKREVPPTGFARLPAHAPGDVFFDIEGDPLFRPDRKLEYLFGLYLADEDRYEAFWAKDFTQERAAFEELVDFLVARRKHYPMMRVYHYASYEKAALNRLMGQYATREIEVPDFLRNQFFVDLYPIVRQALWVSLPSYSLKDLEKYYGVVRETDTKGGDDSIVMFESWLDSHDDAILEDIRKYNEDDCRSTHGLRTWLLERRAEFESRLGSPLAWPEYDPAAVAPPEEEAERTELEAELLAGVPKPEPESVGQLRVAPENVRARWLLGNVVQYHRRDRRPSYREYFERLDSPDTFVDEDNCALGGLVLREDIPRYKLTPRARTFVYTYSFPEQEHYLGSDSPAWPYELWEKAGTVIEIDDRKRLLKIRLSENMTPRDLRALIPAWDETPVKAKEEALAGIARAYLDGTLADMKPATLDLLLAKGPRLRDFAPGAEVQPAEVSADAISERISRLDGGVLFIQGPPGTGKSTKGASAIVDLLMQKKRVGLAAKAHKALHNLLEKIEKEAERRGFRFSGAHKYSDYTKGSTFESKLLAPMVLNVNKVGGGCGFQLFSGTEFAWASDDLDAPFEPFDYVFIDEAGQVAIADALIISRVARNVILLGDPLQLAQVSQGSHPVGADLSILEHLLGADTTLPKKRGIFLNVSHRMHPGIGDFISDGVYEGRLKSAPLMVNNCVASPGLSGSGLVYVPVPHEANSRWSREEVDAVANEVAALLSGGTFTFADNPARRLEQKHILVVSPYNLQRTKITERLAELGFGDVRVGTVNKFQGLEAPVVIYSMATSSGEDLPRDVGFLFEKNRMNVAISRAQCLSVLVCSPALLRTRCKNPEEMELVNLLCAFVERATLRPAGGQIDRNEDCDDAA